MNNDKQKNKKKERFMGDIYAFIVLDKTSINVCNYYLLLELGDPERFHNLLDRSD